MAAAILMACVQPPPHAMVVVHPERATAAPAVLVMPLVCRGHSYDECQMSAWPLYNQRANPNRPASALGPLSWETAISPGLRIKLELAGYTLVESATLRLRPRDRIEDNGTITTTESPGPQTVAELHLDDARVVARSLEISNLLLPTLIIDPVPYGSTGELRVQLVDVATMQPRWVATCKERLKNVELSGARLADCVGNGVLAALAPESLIGKAQ